MGKSHPDDTAGGGARDGDADNIDDDDDESSDVDEYLAALRSLNIDADYNVWSSFRSSVVSRTPTSSVTSPGSRSSPFSSGGVEMSIAEHEEVVLTEAEEAYLARWDGRVDRDEVFGRSYVPTAEEAREMADLARFLGVSDRKMPLIQSKRPTIASVLRPQGKEPRSILLKRGPVLLLPHHHEHCPASLVLGTKSHRTLEEEAYEQLHHERERELILVTSAIIIASVARDTSKSRPSTIDEAPPPPTSTSTRGSSGGGGGFDLSSLSPDHLLSAAVSLPTAAGRGLVKGTSKLIRRNFESCHLLTSVRAVMDLGLCSPRSLRMVDVAKPGDNDSGDDEDDDDEYDGYDDAAFRVVFSTDGNATGTGSGKGTGDHRHHHGCHQHTFVCASRRHKEAWIRALGAAVVGARLRAGGGGDGGRKGWRHEIMRTTMYSAAVCGDADMLERIVSTSGRSVDVPDELGYCAIHYAAMNGHNACLVVMLDAGADPGAKDIDGMSPVDYASKLRNRRALEMLEAGGAYISQRDRDWIDKQSTAAIPTTRHHVAGNTTGGVMSENLSRMNERGEKLKNLEGKASNLQAEAASYKDLASKLKKQAKEESKVFGFF